jgi:hypothetical protein
VKDLAAESFAAAICLVPPKIADQTNRSARNALARSFAFGSDMTLTALRLSSTGFQPVAFLLSAMGNRDQKKISAPQGDNRKLVDSRQITGWKPVPRSQFDSIPAERGDAVAMEDGVAEEWIVEAGALEP